MVYNSRKANDALIERMRKAGDVGGITFGQRRDPCVGIFGKVRAAFICSHSQGEVLTRQ